MRSLVVLSITACAAAFVGPYRVITRKARGVAFGGSHNANEDHLDAKGLQRSIEDLTKALEENTNAQKALLAALRTSLAKDDSPATRRDSREGRPAPSKPYGGGITAIYTPEGSNKELWSIYTLEKTAGTFAWKPYKLPFFGKGKYPLSRRSVRDDREYRQKFSLAPALWSTDVSGTDLFLTMGEPVSQHWRLSNAGWQVCSEPELSETEMNEGALSLCMPGGSYVIITSEYAQEWNPKTGTWRYLKSGLGNYLRRSPPTQSWRDTYIPSWKAIASKNSSYICRLTQRDRGILELWHLSIEDDVLTRHLITLDAGTFISMPVYIGGTSIVLSKHYDGITSSFFVHEIDGADIIKTVHLHDFEGDVNEAGLVFSGGDKQKAVILLTNNGDKAAAGYRDKAAAGYETGWTYSNGKLKRMPDSDPALNFAEGTSIIPAKSVPTSDGKNVLLWNGGTSVCLVFDMDKSTWATAPHIPKMRDVSFASAFSNAPLLGISSSVSAIQSDPYARNG